MHIGVVCATYIMQQNQVWVLGLVLSDEQEQSHNQP